MQNAASTCSFHCKLEMVLSCVAFWLEASVMGSLNLIFYFNFNCHVWSDYLSFNFFLEFDNSILLMHFSLRFRFGERTGKPKHTGKVPLLIRFLSILICNNVLLSSGFLSCHVHFFLGCINLRLIIPNK